MTEWRERQTERAVQYNIDRVQRERERERETESDRQREHCNTIWTERQSSVIQYNIDRMERQTES